MGDLTANIPQQTVHLCIDMQRIFAPGGHWATPWMSRVLPIVVNLVERAPERTLFTRFITPSTVTEAGGRWQHYYRKWSVVTREQMDDVWLNLVPEFERFVPPAAVFDRMTYSAFSDGRLHAWLRNRGTESLIFSGSETDVCVLATVLAAVDHGYRVIIAQDALCSSSDNTHDALLELYRNRFDIQIELASCEEVLERWKLD
jgi:nicotinamidase-related amidase